MRSRTQTVAVSAVAAALACAVNVPVVAAVVAQNRLEHTIAAIGPGIGIGILVGA